MGNHMLNEVDLTGKRFGKYVAIKFVSQNGRHYLCKCDCGNEKIVSQSALLHRNRKMCLRCLIYKHGKSDTPTYHAWENIKGRCLNKKNKRYPQYGGRGITICDRWIKSFNNFLTDMGERPSAKHSIDRIDNDGNYEPSNCRWATREIQDHNTSRIIHDEFEFVNKNRTHLRRIRDRVCIQCGNCLSPRSKQYCEHHRIIKNLKQKERLSKRRSNA